MWAPWAIRGFGVEGLVGLGSPFSVGGPLGEREPGVSFSVGLLLLGRFGLWFFETFSEGGPEG